MLDRHSLAVTFPWRPPSWTTLGDPLLGRRFVQKIELERAEMHSAPFGTVQVTDEVSPADLTLAMKKSDVLDFYVLLSLQMSGRQMISCHPCTSLRSEQPVIESILIEISAGRTRARSTPGPPPASLDELAGWANIVERAILRNGPNSDL